MSEITWSMVTQVPPMMCSEPQKFSEKLHEIKECNWQVNEGPYELVYLRPVLFYGRHGAVAAQGQVGNQECSAENALNFAIPEKRHEVKEEPDETEDKECKGHENAITEEDRAGVRETFVTEESKEKEVESEEKKIDNDISQQNDQCNQSLDREMIRDDNEQSGEIAEIHYNKQNDEGDNAGTQKEVLEASCVTTDDKIETNNEDAHKEETKTSSVTIEDKKETETSNEAEESDEPNQPSENAAVTVFPHKNKQNSENQEVPFNERNDEANNEGCHEETTKTNYVATTDETTATVV